MGSFSDLLRAAEPIEAFRLVGHSHKEVKGGGFVFHHTIEWEHSDGTVKTFRAVTSGTTAEVESLEGISPNLTVHVGGGRSVSLKLAVGMAIGRHLETVGDYVALDEL